MTTRAAESCRSLRAARRSDQDRIPPAPAFVDALPPALQQADAVRGYHAREVAKIGGGVGVLEKK